LNNYGAAQFAREAERKAALTGASEAVDRDDPRKHPVRRSARPKLAVNPRQDRAEVFVA
jgi:hypothetical protein